MSHTAERKRITVLDGWRGVAILLVMMFHFVQCDLMHSWEKIPFRIFAAGWIGVDLFFVLSGFLITSILLDTKEAPRYFQSFYMRRVLRIQPLYLSVMTVLVIMLGMWPGIFGATIYPAQIAAIYSMCVNCFLRHYDWPVTGVAWSLSVEEHFYLIWPFIVRKLAMPRLAGVAISIIFACVAIRSIAVLTGSEYRVFYFNTLCRSDALAIGALLAMLFRKPQLWGLWCKNGRLALGALVVCLGVVWYLQRFQLSSYDKPMATLGYTIVAFFWAAVLTHSLDATRHGNWACRIGNSRFLQTCGKYSYAMYLMHEPLHVLFGRHLWPYFPESHLPMFRMGVIPISETILTLALAWISWELLEKRVLRLKDRFKPWPGLQERTPAKPEQQTYIRLSSSSLKAGTLY